MNKEKLKRMKYAGSVNQKALQLGLSMLEPGVRLKDIDTAIEELILKNDCKPAFKGYRLPNVPTPYPATACISVNDVLVHGVPNSYEIQHGDLITIDVGTRCQGVYVDAARCKIVGQNLEAENLLNATNAIIEAQLDVIKDGCSIFDLIVVSEELAIKHNIYIMPQWGGHGIGDKLHEEPFIPSTIDRTQSKLVQSMATARYKRETLKKGQTICIEPVTSLGSHDIMIDDDHWTVRTRNGHITAHSERCILVTENGYEILT
jgi:methionyl aminopeptidase